MQNKLYIITQCFSLDIVHVSGLFLSPVTQSTKRLKSGFFWFLVCSPFFVFKSLRCSMTQAEKELLHEYALKFNDADVTRENKDVLIEGSVMAACF